jgi:hypothetical protein
MVKIARRFIPSSGLGLAIVSLPGSFGQPWKARPSLTGRAMTLSTIVPEPNAHPPRFVAMAEHRLENMLAMQALAARLRTQAAETSLDIFRRKFEAAAEELERHAGLPPRKPKSPDMENDREYGH